MKKVMFFAIAATAVLSLASCTKGKACMCEKYDRVSGEYEGSKYSEDYETCTGAAFVLSNEDDYYDYDCYDYWEQ